jgi:SAM-dependent methyltransferase
MRGDWRYDLKRFTPKFIHPAIDKARPMYDNFCDAFYSSRLARAVPRARMAAKQQSLVRYTVVTKHPIAEDSPDHIKPRGARVGNTKNTLFNRTFYNVAELLGFQKPYAILDLGCAGGGMVRTFIQDGHNAIGLEGSDYCKKRKKYEWGVIPENLFTCDIAKPFDIFLVAIKPTLPIDKEFAKVWLKEFERSGGMTAKFDLITMWEVLEHLKKEDLVPTLQNVKQHLAQGGLFICSVAHIPDVNDGVVLHQTVEPIEWWDDLFMLNGFKQRQDLERMFKGKYLRNEENSSYRVLQLKESEGMEYGRGTVDLQQQPAPTDV